MASCATSISAGGTCLPLSASSIIASTPDARMEENDARAGREEVLGEMMPFRRAMRSMRYVRD
jgi:hypothetical protein